MFKSVIFSQAFKSPGKAQPVSMLLEAGRSFSPAVMSQSDEDDVDSAFRSEGARVSYIKFFFFSQKRGIFRDFLWKEKNFSPSQQLIFQHMELFIKVAFSDSRLNLRIVFSGV